MHPGGTEGPVTEPAQILLAKNSPVQLESLWMPRMLNRQRLAGIFFATLAASWLEGRCEILTYYCMSCLRLRQKSLPLFSLLTLHAPLCLAMRKWVQLEVATAIKLFKYLLCKALKTELYWKNEPAKKIREICQGLRIELAKLCNQMHKYTKSKEWFEGL